MGALPVLTYHSVDPSGSVVSVDPARFEAQVAGLAAAGWRTLTFAEAVRALAGPGPLPDRHLVFTFDDAYRNVYTEAFPALQRHGFTATVFAISGFMGGTNTWPGHRPPMGAPLPIMSWAELDEMHRHGVEVGAHTRTHPDLSRLPAEAVTEEVVQSKCEIEDRLGAAIETFAYPYGAAPPAAVDVVRDLFSGACTTRMGRCRQGAAPHLLPRIDAYYLRYPHRVLGRPAPLLDGMLAGRQALRDLRARWT